MVHPHPDLEVIHGCLDQLMSHLYPAPTRLSAHGHPTLRVAAIRLLSVGLRSVHTLHQWHGYLVRESGGKVARAPLSGEALDLPNEMCTGAAVKRIGESGRAGDEPALSSRFQEPHDGLHFRPHAALPEMPLRLQSLNLL